MDKPSLDAVFGAGPEAGPPPADLGPLPEETPMQDDPESEQALDDSIDEMFASEDPVARREAFKRAMYLCNAQPH